MIPGLESAPESDFGSFFPFDHVDSGSGSFSLNLLESAPVLESAPLLVKFIVEAYYKKQNYMEFLNLILKINIFFYNLMNIV